VGKYGGGWGEDGSKSLTRISEQAKNWFDLQLSNPDADYFEQLHELDSICRRNKKILIVREWIYSYYFPTLYCEIPNEKIESLVNLREQISSVIIMTRNAIDVWISNGMPEISPFFEKYNKILDVFESLGYPIYKYEDFVAKPVQFMQRLCDDHGIQYDTFLNRWHLEKRINGDSQLKTAARGYQSREIKKPSRRKINPVQVFKLMINTRFREANRRLGYSTNYFKDL
jgi:hypothetical protein